MKYIDADKLIKSINNYQEGAKAALNPIDGDADYFKGKIDTCIDIQEFITSLQQEQPDFPITNEQIKEFLATHPKIKVPEKYKNPDWLFKKQDQPEVDLEKAARHVYESWMGGTMDDVRRDMVTLGTVLKARKEENK